ncbi:MAG: hypothetical protein MI757_13925 [Pirellulales bacterium]|nr:hypothetical protein [Pirellulales bacterium]
MARHEQDRENLLRDATALVQRVEFVMPNSETPVFVGFRRDGCASVYIDQDPVYHFNTANELRRAFVDGQLYKAQGSRLIAMERERSSEEVQLMSRPISDEDATEFLSAMNDSLSDLRRVIESRSVHVTGQVPADADLLGRVSTWLSKLPEPIAIAVSPRAL